MGEEYAESNPFLYFTSHGDPALIEAVRQGRLNEFAYFAEQGTPPDPQAESTFEDSKLNHDLRETGKHKRMLTFYKDLIALRKRYPALTNPNRHDTSVLADASQKLIWLIRRYQDTVVAIAFNWHHTQPTKTSIPNTGKAMHEVFNSTAIHYAERPILKPKALDVVTANSIEVAPKSFVVYA